MKDVMNSATTEVPLPLGETVITTRAKEALNAQEVLSALWKHAHEPWGKCFDPEDEQSGVRVKEDRRLISNHLGSRGQPFRIATETENCLTTVCLSGKTDFSSAGLVDAWVCNLA